MRYHWVHLDQLIKQFTVIIYFLWSLKHYCEKCANAVAVPCPSEKVLSSVCLLFYSSFVIFYAHRKRTVCIDCEKSFFFPETENETKWIRVKGERAPSRRSISKWNKIYFNFLFRTIFLCTATISFSLLPPFSLSFKSFHFYHNFQSLIASNPVFSCSDATPFAK